MKLKAGVNFKDGRSLDFECPIRPQVTEEGFLLIVDHKDLEHFFNPDDVRELTVEGDNAWWRKPTIEYLPPEKPATLADEPSFFAGLVVGGILVLVALKFAGCA